MSDHPAEGEGLLEIGRFALAPDEWLGQAAVQRGWITPEQLEQSLRQWASNPRIPLAAVLVRNRYLTSAHVALLLSENRGSGTAMFCTTCRVRYRIKGTTAARCPRCRATLVPEVADETLMGGDAPDLPRDLPPEVKEALDRPNRRLGKFVKVALAGQGGMGAVWKCYDLQLQRWVAVKLVEGISDEIAARVLREAKAAARLQHPNIVQVYETGRYDNVNVIVMQFVQHQPLQWGKVPLRRTLELARDVVRAVQYAHEQGIIHRDIKPGNILIDAGGRPYVADFGLAKEADANQSRTGKVVGTPAYMSPEQARGEAVDARTDVYGLGATMYEMVTGRPPYERESVPEILSAVSAEDPPLPRQVRADVPWEVEAIILKAMAKDLRRRYQTAAEMADDIDRYLKGEPIMARRAGVGYRVRRFLSRRPWLAGAAVAAAGLAAYLGWDWRVAWMKFEQAQREPDAARRLVLYKEASRWIAEARSRAKAVEAEIRAEAEHWQSYDQGWKDWEKVGALVRAGRTAEARRLTARAREQFERANAVVTKAAAYHMIGRCLQIEGRHFQAREAWERALALDPNYGPAALELAKMILDDYFRSRGLPEAQVRDGVVELGILPEETEVQARLRGRAEQLMAQLTGADAQFATALRCAASGNYAEAARALAAYTEAEPWDDQALRLFAVCLYYQREFQQAEEAATRAIELDPAFGNYYWRGMARQALRRFDAAMEDYTRCIELSPGFIAGYMNRGLVRREQGDLDGAIKDFDRAIQIDPKVDALYLNRALVRQMKGDSEGAAGDCDRAIQLNPSYVDAYVCRAVARHCRGDLEGAFQDSTRALQLDPKHADAYVNRGLVWYDRGDPKRAIEDFDRALALQPRHARAWTGRANARLAKGDVDGAIEDHSRALAINPRLFEAWYNRGNARWRKGDGEGAIQDYTRALEINPGFAEAYVNRGNIRHSKGDLKGAIEDYSKAVEVSPSHATAYANRGMVRGALGQKDPERAKEHWTAAVKDLETALQLAPPDWPHRMEVGSALQQARQILQELLREY